MYPIRGAWNKIHSENWEEAMVSGNGEQGVMVFGNPRKETIIGNHSRLYLAQGTSQQLPNMAPYLEELRNIINQKGYEAAQSFFYEKAQELGYQGLTMSDPFHPAFHLYIESTIKDVTNYSRSVNFETGEISVKFFDENGVLHNRKTFVSRADHVIVHTIQNDAMDVCCHLEIEDYKHSLIDHQREIRHDKILLNNTYVKSRGGYRVEMRIEAPGGKFSINNNILSIEHAQKILLLIKIDPFQSNTIEPMIVGSEIELLQPSYELLFMRHKKIHAKMFNRVSLQLASSEERKRSIEDLIAETKQTNKIPLALIEKLYDSGRYMFICSAGELSPNLQGIWTGTFEPAWSGDYTFDTNVQLSIAAALSCNLVEGMQGFFRLINEFIPEFRENARLYYGSRGIMTSAHSSNTGKHFHWNEEWPLQFWTCGAGWLGHWFYQYYLHTGDKDFLANEAIPFLKECALFYEDFLIEDSQGVFRFTPSYSAENGCGDNSTQDIAVAKEVLRNLIDSYKELGIHSPETGKWAEMLKKLPDYMINHEGVLKEWISEEKEENHNHRHFSHLYPIFQSREFTAETEPELWSASKMAFDKRLEAWLRNPDADTSSTHGRMHAALCATQFNKKDLVYEILQMMITKDSIYSTLMTSHYNNKEVFNVDGNGAIPQIINEMIVDGCPGRIKLLQALPIEIAQGTISGISLAKQIKVEEFTWDINRKEATIKFISAIHQEVFLDIPLFPNAHITNTSSCDAWQEQGKWKLQLFVNKIVILDIVLQDYV